MKKYCAERKKTDFHHITTDTHLASSGAIYGRGVDARLSCCHTAVVLVLESLHIWNSASLTIGDDGLGLGDSSGAGCEQSEGWLVSERLVHTLMCNSSQNCQPTLYMWYLINEDLLPIQYQNTCTISTYCLRKITTKIKFIYMFFTGFIISSHIP